MTSAHKVLHLKEYCPHVTIGWLIKPLLIPFYTDLRPAVYVDHIGWLIEPLLFAFFTD